MYPAFSTASLSLTTMSRLIIKALFSLSLRRRAFSTVAESAARPSATQSAAHRAAANTNMVKSKEVKDVFWMRDPKTGYYIPENRFAEIDVAELRAQLLGKK